MGMQRGLWQRFFAPTARVCDAVPQVFLALSCLAPLPKLVIVSNFTTAHDQATKAFMATGIEKKMQSARGPSTHHAKEKKSLLFCAPLSDARRHCAI